MGSWNELHHAKPPQEEVRKNHVTTLLPLEGVHLPEASSVGVISSSNRQDKDLTTTAPQIRPLAVKPTRRCSSLRGQGNSPDSGVQLPHASGKAMDFRAMEYKKGVRIRLSFEDPGMLTPLQVEQGLSKCWIQVHNHILSIGHLAAHIAVKFDLQQLCRDGVALEMDGYSLPPTEMATLLQDSDLVCVKRQRRLESAIPVLPAAGQTREVVANRLKVVSRKDANGTLRTHVQGPSGPLPTVDVSPYHMNRDFLAGPTFSMRQPSYSTPQGPQIPPALHPLQVPQAPCPQTPTQSGGVEVRAPGNETEAPRNDEESSVLTVPRASEVVEVLEADGTVEKNVVTEKCNFEENHCVLSDEPSSEKVLSLVTVEPIGEKRKLMVSNGPIIKQYKRLRVGGGGVSIKSVAAVRAALIGTGRSHSRYRLQPELRERSASNYSEMWARKAFDAWRTQSGHSTDLSIEDLSEQSDVKPFVDLLCVFMLQLTKQNGQLYPPTSIQAMLRAIGRIIRARESKRTDETGVAKVPFNIFLDPRYQDVKVAVEEAVSKSAALECAKEVAIMEHGPVMEEEEMLKQCKYSRTHPEGCSRRFAYFCLRDFCVKGRTELRELSDVDFELYTDEHGDCLRYTQGMGVNWKLSIEEQPRHSIRCYIQDVVETYKILMAHRPVWLDTEPPPHALFLTSLPKWSDREVWYAKMPVGKNKFSNWNQDLVATLGGLPGRSTKTVILATRMDGN